MKEIPLSEIKDDLSRFLRRIGQARDSLRAGRGGSLEDLETQ